jgi:hypothetical protein
MARTHSARRWARQPSQQMHIAKDNSNLSRLMPNMHTGALNASARLQRKKNTWRYYSLDGLIVDCDNTIRLAPHHWSDAELISWHVNKVFDLFAFDRSTHKALLSIRTKNRHVPRNGKLRTCIIYALTASFFNHLKPTHKLPAGHGRFPNKRCCILPFYLLLVTLHPHIWHRDSCNGIALYYNRQ